MKKIILSLTLAFVFAASGIAFVGCGKKSTSIYGTWDFYGIMVNEELITAKTEGAEENEFYASFIDSSFILKKDGTGSIIPGPAMEEEALVFTFVYENKVGTMNFEEINGGPESGSFVIADGVLTVTIVADEDATVLLFKK